MTSYNDITGDPLVSKSSTNNFRDNYDRIFKSRNKCQCHKDKNSTLIPVNKTNVCGVCKGEW